MCATSTWVTSSRFEVEKSLINVLSLVVLLILLAGVIAYAGDRLGMLVARRRLSLFGIRPRRTGQIVGVVAGILIMLTTLVVLALAFRGATQAIINAQQIGEELNRLRAERLTLEGEIRTLEGQIGTLERRLDSASETIGKARDQLLLVEKERDAALSARDSAQDSVDALRAERGQLQVQVAGLQQQFSQMSEELGEAQIILDSTRGRLERAQEDLVRAEEDRDLAIGEVGRARNDVIIAQEKGDLLQAEVDAVQYQLAETTGKLGNLESQLTDTETELAIAKSVLSETTREREQAQEERNQALKTLDSLGEIINELGLEVGNLRVQAEVLRAENTVLQFGNEELGDANRTLVGQNVNLQVLNDQLRSEILASNTQERGLQSQVDGLQLVLEGQAAELARARVQFEQVTSGQVVYSTDDLIYSGVLTESSLTEAREELSQFVRAASEETLAKGAGEVQLRTDQFEGLVAAVTQTTGVDLVLFMSPKNQFRSEGIVVSVEALPNTKLFEKGHLVTSRQVHLGTRESQASQSEIRNALSRLLIETRDRLTTAGLFSPDPLQLTQTEENFSNQLLRLTGPVIIGVVAADDVYRGGPALLELLILN
jgi:uncharacterized protein (DUF3084 family)